jgi:hypothetical protein
MLCCVTQSPGRCRQAGAAAVLRVAVRSGKMKKLALSMALFALMCLTVPFVTFAGGIDRHDLMSEIDNAIDAVLNSPQYQQVPSSSV